MRTALADHGAAVLVAPPGTGKTTALPPELVNEPWRGNGRIVVVEPRRLAVRAAARRMASVRGEQVGQTIGYSVRGDRRVGRGTRVEVMTDGLLVRRVQQDPGLDGVAAVLFDEFHERSVDADLALALLLDVRESLRPDLRIVVMSATLDAGPVADLLGGTGRPGGAAVIRTEAPVHQVETRYRPGSTHDRIEDRIAAVVREALSSDPGDLLVFLPGRGEIRRTARALGGLGSGVVLHELHGSVPAAEQDRALAPDPTGRRRVVLATSIAETSLTVPGVRVVIDSGRRRTNRSDPATGLPGLVTGPVSLAGADQRRGRAGRTAPGVCYRLWSPTDERHRPDADVPEIVDGDLAPLVLQTLAWGAPVDSLRWLDPPGGPQLSAAHRLLADLGALGDDHRLTTQGRRLADLGFHPRLGAVVLAAGTDGDLAPDLAAVLEADHPGDPDVVERVRALRRGDGPDEVRRAAEQWRRQLSRTRRTPAPSTADLDRAVSAGVLAGYRDRLARRRPGSRTDDRGRAQAVYQLVGGGEVALDRSDHPLARSEWLVVAGLDRGPAGAVGRIHLAAPVAAEHAIEALADRIRVERTVRWDRRRGDVVADVRRFAGAVTLDTSAWADPPIDQVRAALADGLSAEGPGLLRGWAAAEELRARLLILRSVGAPCPDPAGWPDPLDVDDWVGPLVDRAVARGATRRRDLERLDVAAAMADAMTWATRRALDELAPRRFELPGGRAAALRYRLSDDDAGAEVVMSTRLQDLFGIDGHPTVVRGRVAIVVELLSPAGRPLQRTSYLPGFWRGSYAGVRSEMRGRYPKYRWPEHPWQVVGHPKP